MKFVILSVVLLGLLAICLAEDSIEINSGGAGSLDGIINGKPAEADEIPYQAFIRSGWPGEISRLCGGTLIRPNWILTAAHCVYGNATQVMMGGTNRNNMAYRAIADKRIIHEGYHADDSTIIHDIALLRLPTVPSGRGIAIGELAPAKMKSLVGKSVRTSGFGLLNEMPPIRSMDLMKVTLTMISNKACKNAYKKLNLSPNLIQPTTICTEYSPQKDQNICEGDSGGPLVYKTKGKDVIVGVVSFSFDCHHLPAGYVGVSSYRKWIDTTIAKNS